MTYTMPDPDQVEARFVEALDRWINGGVPPGHFLSAVLKSDLFGAMHHADMHSMQNLPHLCSYIYNRIRADCHGSPAKYDAWIAKHKKERDDKEKETVRGLPHG